MLPSALYTIHYCMPQHGIQLLPYPSNTMHKPHLLPVVKTYHAIQTGTPRTYVPTSHKSHLGSECIYLKMAGQGIPAALFRNKHFHPGGARGPTHATDHFLVPNENRMKMVLKETKSRLNPVSHTTSMIPHRSRELTKQSSVSSSTL